MCRSRDGRCVLESGVKSVLEASEDINNADSTNKFMFPALIASLMALVWQHRAQDGYASRTIIITGPGIWRGCLGEMG
jgi:hypothetical protein